MAINYSTLTQGSAAAGPLSRDRQWWRLDKSEIPGAVYGVVQFLKEHQSRRETQNLTSARLYGNLSIMGLNGLTYSKVASVQNALKDRISYNICSSVVDTLVAKICKNKPKPLFLTSGGDYKLQRKAKKLDKFAEGVFYENKSYELGEMVFRDSCVFDAGIVHVYNHYNRVKHERVLPQEIYVDEVEAFYGEPRQIHRVKNIDRKVLEDLFPEKRGEIAIEKSATPDNLGGYENVADVVTVTESWHLPSGPDATDGRHVITTEHTLLLSEPWEKDFFPFVFLKRSPRLMGFWGQGLVEQIQNIQLEINKLLWVIQRSMHLAGTFKIWVGNSSKIVKEHLNNDIGSIITGTEAPQYLVPPIVPPEVYSHFERLKAAGYEVAGISQLSANSQKPAGLNSGKALREYNDIETDRFQVDGHAYENFYLELARQSISVARDIYEEDKNLTVKVPGKKFIETIKWKEVSLPDDEYLLKLYPISSLPNDPTGRLETVTEYAQAGFMSPRTARRLLDFPDIEAQESLANASEDYLHEILERIVDADIDKNGKLTSNDEDNEGDPLPVYTAPEPYDDLSLAKELAMEYYQQGKCAGLEEQKLDLLRQFMAEVDSLVQTAQQGMVQQAQMAAMAAQPMAAPQPQPVSPLVQNTPAAA